MKCPFSHQKSAYQSNGSVTTVNPANSISDSAQGTVHLSASETARLKALSMYNIIDTAAEPAFEEIVHLAAQICQTPVALISLLEENRQWFKAKVGLNINETGRDIAFCNHTIQSDDLFVVPDALQDERFKNNPLVTGDPNIRFYAGMPIKTPDGHNIGTLCVIDTVARELDDNQRELLETLTHSVLHLLELRKNTLQVQQSKEVLRNLMRLNEDFIRSIDNKREVFKRMLEYILKVTDSEYGFIGEVLYNDKQPYLKSYAITNIAWNDETRTLYEKYAAEGMEFHNLNTLFGHTLRTGEQVIANDPANDPRRGGLPKGHPELKHYLGVPIKDSNGDLIGMIGLSNKRNGYSENDVVALQPFVTNCAVMILAMQMQSRNLLIEEEQRQKDMFLANMSHEIRTPLNAIIGFNDLLQNTRLDDDQQRYVETISIASRNLNVIINDILDISKLESGMLILEKKPFDIEKVVRQVVQLNSSRAKQKGLKIMLTFDQDIPQFIVGDETRLSQILINLINNAIKFTSEGYVELKVLELRKTVDQVSLRFSVSDTGIGIAPEKLSSIFERFTQAESSTTRLYGGTGLGLNIVKSLVGLHKGKVDVKSTMGKGSEFIVEIPFAIATSNVIAEIENDTPADLRTLLDGLNLLLVEDNEHNQFLAQTYLVRNGAKVTTAANGKIALDILKNNTFDVILMDIQMPEMDGNETTTYIRKKLKLDVPIVACSAHALESEKERCLANGMNEYITKPYNESEMVRTLAKYGKYTGVKLPASRHTRFKLADADEVLTTLKHIEQKEGVKFTKTLVDMFSKNSDDLIHELTAHLQAKSWVELEKKAHYTAGVLANFPFLSGIEKSRKVEKLAKKKDEAGAQEAVHALVDYLKYCHEQVAKYR